MIKMLQYKMYPAGELGCPTTALVGYLLDKYPKHMFYGEIRTKQYLSDISICLLSILYNSKFILMAMSLGTSAVVVSRVHCNKIFCFITEGPLLKDSINRIPNTGYSYLLSVDW